MPAVLAALTSHRQQVAEVPLDRVVLLHSGGQPTSGSSTPQRPGTASTRIHAERAATLLTQLLPDVSVECQSIGTMVSDLNAVLDRLTRVLRDVVDPVTEPVLIDYTGGTKAMAAALVSWHLTNDDSQEWGPTGARQLYVDETAGVLRANGASWLISALGLSLQNIAALHGFVMDAPGWPNRRPTPDEVKEADAYTFIKAKNEAHKRGCDKCPQELLGDSQVLPARLIRPEGQARQGNALGQVDVLLRFGHRVSVIEVKTNAIDLENTLGWAITRARAAFGGATNVFFTHANAYYDLKPYRGALLTRIGATRAAPLYRKVRLADFHEIMPEIKSVSPNRPRVSPVAKSQTSSVLSVSSIGDSRLAPLTSAVCSTDSTGERDLLLLASSEAQTAVKSTTDVVQNLYVNSGRIRVHARRIDSGDTAALIDLLERQVRTMDSAEVVLDVTAGTKAVTAAMTTVHHRQPDRSRLVYLDPRARTRSELGGSVTPLVRYDAPWTSYFNDGWTRMRCADIDGLRARSTYLYLATAAALRALERTGWAEPAPAMLLPPENQEPAPGRPTAVLLLGDRLLGITEGRVRHRNSTTQEPAAKADTFSTGALLSTGIQLNQALVGVAGETVGTILTWNPRDEAMRIPKSGGWHLVDEPSMQRRLQIVRSTGQLMAVAKPAEPHPQYPDRLAAGAERVIGAVVDALIRSVVQS